MSVNSMANFPITIPRFPPLVLEDEFTILLIYLFIVYLTTLSVAQSTNSVEW
jgi:hypothetical protein